MDNFDLKKYLAEGRLLKEDIDFSEVIFYLEPYGSEEEINTYITSIKGTEKEDMGYSEDYIKDFKKFKLKENKMDNFDLKKYLAEGRLLKENIDMATILSHDDYYELYIGNRAEHDASSEEEQFSDEYMIDLKPGMYQMIYWNDEGPDYNVYDSKEEYVKDVIGGFWGEDHFIEKFGIEAELDAAGDNWVSVFHKHIEDNIDMYYEELNKLINNSEADGDSANGVVLLQNGKVVAGEAIDIRTRFD